MRCETGSRSLDLSITAHPHTHTHCTLFAASPEAKGSVPALAALASKPDIHEAGVACYEWLRMLDQPAAQKVYSKIEAVSPIILEGLQVP